MDTAAPVHAGGFSRGAPPRLQCRGGGTPGWGGHTRKLAQGPVWSLHRSLVTHRLNGWPVWPLLALGLAVELQMKKCTCYGSMRTKTKFCKGCGLTNEQIQFFGMDAKKFLKNYNPVASSWPWTGFMPVYSMKATNSLVWEKFVKLMPHVLDKKKKMAKLKPKTCNGRVCIFEIKWRMRPFLHVNTCTSKQVSVAAQWQSWSFTFSDYWFPLAARENVATVAKMQNATGKEYF